MGLLDGGDSGSIFDDPKRMSLLAMALGMLNHDPTKRSSFGQDLARGGLLGMQTYGDVQQGNLKQAAMKQEQSLRDIQIQNAKREQDIQGLPGQFFSPGVNPIVPNDDNGNPMPSSSPKMDYQGYMQALMGKDPIKAAQLQPMMDKMRFQQYLASRTDPSQNAPQTPQSPGQNFAGANPAFTSMPAGKGVIAAPSGPQGPDSTSYGKNALFNKYSALANEADNHGFFDQAQYYRDLAEKSRPKLKDEQVRIDPTTKQPVVVRNYEDGTVETSPFSPTASVDYLNTGGSQVGIDKYTGKPTGMTVRNSMTPDGAASNAIASARLRYDTGMGAGGGGMSGMGGMAGTAGGGQGSVPQAIRDQLAKSQAEGLQKGGIDYKTGLDSNVSAGSDLMMRIGESRKALEQFKPGMGADTRLQVARFAQALHAPDGLVNLINDGNVAAKQEFQKLAAQQAMESLKAAMGGSGRITQAEFKVFQANNPNIELDKNAIDKIYSFAQKVHARNLDEQQGLQQHLQNGGNISQWPSMWAQEQAKRMSADAQPASTRQTNTDPLVVVAPDGSAHRFPSAAAAANYRKAIGQ